MKKNGKSVDESAAVAATGSPVGPKTPLQSAGSGSVGVSAGGLGGGATKKVSSPALSSSTPVSGGQGHRYSLASPLSSGGVGGAPRTTHKSDDPGKIFKLIDDNIIGKSAVFLGPYGRRKVVYADYTSSGRSLQFLEDYIIKEVLPAYGDMNCTSAVTGLQSQLYYNEVRNLVKSAVNASCDDEIIFCDGSYASPIERLCFLLCCSSGGMGGGNEFSGGQQSPTRDINNSSVGDWPSTSYNDSGIRGGSNGPVLFVSTCEMASTLQPWLDAGAQIERVSKNREGFLDLDDLSKKLAKHQNSSRRLVGLFSSASRLTGILADDVATTILLHQYGAISIWDYSHAAPFAPIQTNSPLPGANKDVVFFNTNKFVGGVQAPGILVIKKNLLNNLNVTQLHDSVGVIVTVRAGLVIQLKESLGVQNILNRLEKICKQMMAHIRTIPEIVLLGPNSSTAKRMATVCFLVKHPRGTFLHNRFVVAVLNDVFGIQASAGAHIGYAMGIHEKLAVDYDRLLIDDTIEMESIRPGYTRLSLPYFMSDNEIGFILEALKMVATEAWKLLPQYECDSKTGEWRHHSNSLVKERKWLGAIRYTDGKMLFADRKVSGPGVFPQNYQDCLHTARNLFNRARKMAQKASDSDERAIRLTNNSAEALRWYMLPGEAHELLLGHSHNVKNLVPFDPNTATESPSFIMHRHNSLSALDIKKFMSRSVPLSPVQSHRHQSTPSPVSPLPRADFCVSPPTLNFSLGGEVTPDLAPICSPKVTNLINNESAGSLSGPSRSRNRCNTWSSSSAFRVKLASRNGSRTNSTGGVGGPEDFEDDELFICPEEEDDNSSPTTTTSTNAAAAAAFAQTALFSRSRRRVCSCSSQTDLRHAANTPTTGSPTTSLFGFNIHGLSSINDCPEDIQAYVKEVTQDIATEIKSELREVISKVDNALESTEPALDSSYNLSNLHQHLTSAEEMKSSDAVSASDVAQYLREFSIEMASEVKSEIREMCANVKDFTEHPRRSSPTDLEGLKVCLREVMEGGGGVRGVVATTEGHRKSESVIGSKPRNQTSGTATKSSDCDLKPSRSESFPSAVPSSSLREAGTGSGPQQTEKEKHQQQTNNQQKGRYTGAISKLSDSTETASRDSGINMCFGDGELNQSAGSLLSSRRPLMRPDSLSFGSSSETEDMGLSGQVGRHPLMAMRQPSDADSSTSSDNDTNKWQNLPKEAWKQASEAMDEFEMISNGDRVLVAVNCSAASISMLHAIRQFSRARNMSIKLAVCSVGGSSEIDPRALMLYLRDLGVRYFYEEKTSDNLMDVLVSVARRHKYNVISLGTTTEKIAENFLSSLFYKGQLRAIPANCLSDGIRVISPFMNIRERVLESFAYKKDLPCRALKLGAGNSDDASLLISQKLSNPVIYENIILALKPLMTQRNEDLNLAFDHLKRPKNNRR